MYMIYVYVYVRGSGGFDFRIICRLLCMDVCVYEVDVKIQKGDDR